MASGTGKRSTKRKSPGRRNNRSKKKQQEAFRNEVILWIALAVAIILFVSNLGFGGVVGGMVSDFFFGVFGLLSYIVPILLFVGTAFLISNKKNQIAGIKFFSGIMLAVFLCLFFQLVLDREDVYSAKAAFVYARANKSGGGFIGGLLEALLCPNIGLIGTYVADIAVLIISFVLLTEKSLLSPMKKSGQETILITRVDEEKSRETEKLLAGKYPEGSGYTYFKDAKVAICGKFPEKDGVGTIVVATGGTSDIPVAEEAALTAEALGNQVERLYDVGVAGLHRLLSHMDSIMDARVIIAIAGMEGALASVIGGLADCPVIAVPTSIGYGASFGGVSALLSMLNSCASGVSVVNIDNGFGAGYLASMMNHMRG